VNNEAKKVNVKKRVEKFNLALSAVTTSKKIFCSIFTFLLFQNRWLQSNRLSRKELF